MADIGYSFDKQTLVPAPRSFFMDVKCPGCFTITTDFSHAQTDVVSAASKRLDATVPER